MNMICFIIGYLLGLGSAIIVALELDLKEVN